MVMALVAALALSAGSLALAENYKGFPRGDALITVEELKAMIDAKDPNLVLIAVEKGAGFKTGHIPGAVNVWRPAYEPEVGNPYPFDGMMINRAEFQEFARSLGVNNDSKVVIYDTKYDATRLWWGFFLYGKEDVRVLDGGYYAWKMAGYDTDTALLGTKDVKPGNFVAKPRRNGWVASMDDVWRAKTSDQIQVWDTREPNEWDGSTKKGNAKRAGRIPWAEFQSWKEFRTKPDGEHPTGFKTAAEIQKVIDKFKMDEGKDQIFYCQSGVRTTTGIFALYLMGWDIDRLHNYDGSWLEWSFHEGNPIASGK
jgi:thiosulfate/3-mercaptopyruvate sulfurtransferase